MMEDADQQNKDTSSNEEARPNYVQHDLRNKGNSELRTVRMGPLFVTIQILLSQSVV